MTTAILTFEHDNKRYTATAAPFVRLPDGVLVKVKSTDEQGSAEVVASGKKNPTADEVSVATEVPLALDVPDAVRTPDLATLKKEWEDAEDAALLARADQGGIEMAIAAELVKRGEGKKAKPTIRLGGVVYKAQKPKDGSGPPRLVKVPEVGPEAV